VKACTRLGLDVTWRCNLKCRHCFYLRTPKLHQAEDVPEEQWKRLIDQGKAGGLDHVVIVGYGEPSLCPSMPAILDYCHAQGMATSMITNGATGLHRFKAFFARGLDHLHISSHGLCPTLDEIVGVPGTFARQAELKEWLALEGLLFRTNVTLQQANYRELPELAEYEISHGVHHFVLLGFLPHYEWRGHVHEIAVHPGELRPYIEDAASQLVDAGTLFTIRYHPLCHLAPHYWMFVVNANHVYYDPWEWNYDLQVNDLPRIEQKARELGEAVACKTPCDQCLARRYCGGWNRTYAEAFDGAGLQPIREVPEMYRAVWDQEGGLHDLNPANHETGTIRTRQATEPSISNDVREVAEEFRKLFAACRDHGCLMGPNNPRPNPYGTFADALRNLANELPGSLSGWGDWLRVKADSLDAVVAAATSESPDQPDE